jgi:hypothetical protein
MCSHLDLFPTATDKYRLETKSIGGGVTTHSVSAECDLKEKNLIDTILNNFPKKRQNVLL